MKKYFAIISIILFAAGCGYHIAGKGAPSIKGVESIFIPIFKNETRKSDADGIITIAVVNEFINLFRVTDREAADAILEGTIKDYAIQGVSFSQSDVVGEYRLTIVLSVRLLRKSDSSILWQDEITDYEDFRVDTADVLLTKDRESEALRKIAGDAARLVRERLVEGF